MGKTEPLFDTDKLTLNDLVVEINDRAQICGPPGLDKENIRFCVEHLASMIVRDHDEIGTDRLVALLWQLAIGKSRDEFGERFHS